MKINIIVDNDKCWHLNTIRKLMLFLKKKDIYINHIWVLPEKLLTYRGLQIPLWYFKIFGFYNFIKMFFFYFIVLVKNLLKNINSFSKLAKINGIKCTYIKSINDQLLYESLKTENINYNLILTNHIIDSKLLDLKNNFFINKHSSLLPSYKGLMPYIWTKIFFDNNGVSIHLVNKKIDSGQIIYQRRIKDKFKSMVEFYINIYDNFSEDFLQSLLNLNEKKFINSNHKESIFLLPNKKEYKQFVINGGKIINLNDFLEINRITN